jgi:hypothetical protein
VVWLSERNVHEFTNGVRTTQTVIEALLCVELGGQLLRVLFLNMPALRDEILLTLIKCAPSAPQRITYASLSLSLSVQ